MEVTKRMAIIRIISAFTTMVLIGLMIRAVTIPQNAYAEDCGGDDVKDEAGILSCATGSKVHDLNIAYSELIPKLSFTIVTEKTLPAGKSNSQFRQDLVYSETTPKGANIDDDSILITYVPNDGKVKWSVTPGGAVSSSIVNALNSSLFSDSDKQTIEHGTPDEAVSLMIDRTNSRITSSVGFVGNKRYRVTDNTMSYDGSNADYIARSEAYRKEHEVAAKKAEAEAKKNDAVRRANEQKDEMAWLSTRHSLYQTMSITLVFLCIVVAGLILKMVMSITRRKTRNARMAKLDELLAKTDRQTAPGLDSDAARERARNHVRGRITYNTSDTDVESMLKQYYYEDVLPDIMKTSKNAVADADWYSDFLKQADDDDWSKWKNYGGLDVDAMVDDANRWNRSGRLDHVALAKREHEIDSKFNDAWTNFRKNSPEIFNTVGLSRSKLRRLMRSSDNVDQVLEDGDASWKWMVDEWDKVKDEAVGVL